MEQGALWGPQRVERLVMEHTQRLYKTALAVTANPDDARELVQDCFLRLFEAQPALMSAEHEKAWLLRVTVNLCKNRLRSGWYRKTEPLTDRFAARDPEQVGLSEAIAALPGPQRAAIHLYYYEGYTVREIAALTRRRESTVKSDLHRARRRLKAALTEEPETGEG